jgi:hypothetical protein
LNTDSKSRKPPEIPLHSSKRPFIVAEDVEIKLKHYHFDLKLKPESVPQWNGNPDGLARRISKITVSLIILRIYERNLER